MIIEGKRVVGGVAIGNISIYRKVNHRIERRNVESVEIELERFRAAREQVKRTLKSYYKKAVSEIGASKAMIFEVYEMILDDQNYIESVAHMIRAQKVNAEFAVEQMNDLFQRRFATMDDVYMKERAADITDINKLVISFLNNAIEKVKLEEACILLADELSPSEMAQLDFQKVLALVIRFGSMNSHVAIMARAMNIPTLIRTDYPRDVEGKYAIVDGDRGKIIINPGENVIERYLEKKEKQQRKIEQLQALKGEVSMTQDGKRVQLCANIAHVRDVEEVCSNHADGIGLFRSEFLFLESENYPTEEEQFAVYRTVAEQMQGKKVIIRTLDLGADKQVDYIPMGQEKNPAMGCRGIRICLRYPEIFKTQLRAIYRASFFGQISIMFPMIISMQEIRRIQELIQEVKTELTEEGLPFQDCELGIMIETPAAVMISDLLAKELDFFSVGTNDLTQYTLAIDRENQALEDFYQQDHEAILRMLQIVVNNGHKEGCWVGICGELAADTTLTETFLQMGFDEISVSPSRIFEVKDAIRKSYVS